MPTSPRARVLLAVAVLVAIVGVVLVVRAATRSDPPMAQPEPTAVSPAPSATPSEPQIAQPEPFRLRIRKLRGEPADKALLFGGKVDRRKAVVERAGLRAARALERYLNGIFVNPDTRFTPGPVRGLLTQRAFAELSKPDERGLGIRGPAISGGRTGAATAWPIVMYRHAKPIAVTVRFRATMRVAVGDKLRPLVQSGTMVFIPARSGWQADMVSVRLRLPDEVPEEAATEATGSEPATEPAEEQSS